VSLTSLGEPIAGTANLYAWGEGQILKLYGDDIPEGFVEWLGKVEGALHVAGLPVPKIGDIVDIDGRLGQIYERIEGSSMAENLLEAPEVDSGAVVELAHLFAEIHAQIHACGDIPAELSPQPQVFPSLIRRAPGLPQDLKEATLKAFDEVPDGDRLCHGDYHPYNVVMSPRGPVVIDWNNAHTGNPLEDVARSTLILSGVPLSQPSYGSLFDRFNQAYLERYFQLRPAGQQQLEAWRPIVAAVRLNDGIPELQEWLLGQIRIGLGLPG
jgi:tRNA A-37 threonylcarbamoyl transferase component Bud32